MREEEARNLQRVRAGVRDLVDLAARRRVPLFRLYWEITHGGETLWHSYTRTGLQCVVALDWNEASREFSAFSGWAVATDGSFFRQVNLAGDYQRRRGDIREQRAVCAESDVDGYSQLTGRFGASNTDFFMRQFVAAASALMAPVELADGKRTGIQPDGWIGYWA
ncbi:hypothetical protein [Kitasatospora paranensis]|uniref:hypothetical protein n=1 Tax=Kitasatospora paranensis TaxID=258053 RepID=UPI0031EE5991